MGSIPKIRKDRPLTVREIKQRYYLKNHDRLLPILVERINRRRKVIRFEVLKAHSGDPPFCACCGDTHIEFLTIDHLGKKQEWEKGRTGIYFYKLLKRLGYPKEFQVLCFNCNCAKGIYGSCPHKSLKQEASVIVKME